MEDISRELEREIARAKPSPHKASREKRILIVDDFGELKSGGYLKVLVYLFSIMSIIGILGTAGFIFLYTGTARESAQLKQELSGLERKLTRLTNEKEILMARLVISGKEPVLTPHVAKDKKSGVKAKEKPAIKALSKKRSEKKASGGKTVLGLEPKTEKVIVKKPSLAVVGTNDPLSAVDQEQAIAIEKFAVTRTGTDGDLAVRFDIRNLSKKPGGISGRIFTVLKPDNSMESKWLVVPAAPLKNGIPSLYRRGQYFSISRFKPVQFTIKNQANPNLFKKASIYIFNDDGDLMFKSIIDITEAENKG